MHAPKVTKQRVEKFERSKASFNLYSKHGKWLLQMVMNALHVNIGWAGPRLPNELLLMVADHFHDDPQTLCTLLFVDRFFFHAAVPLLYSNPFKFVRSRNKHKLTELILASVLHTQRKHSQSRPSTSSAKEFTVAGFLARFGLLPVDGCAPSPLLQDAFSGVSPTTTDYAQHLKVELPKEEHNSKIDSILRTKPRLAKADSLTTVFDIRGQEIQVQRWVANTTATKRFYSRHPAECVWKRLSALLIQCYPASISALHLGVYDSHWLLPLADKLERLHTVHLQRAKAMEEDHLQDTMSFICKNRIAFPQKRPIYLRFDSEWNTPRVCDPPQGMREFKREQQWPRVALYEAVGSPVHMNASPCPRFYEDVSSSMRLNSLDSFVDMDRRRFKYGESLFQQAFLWRCQNLRALQLVVSDPKLFSWAMDVPAGLASRESGTRFPSKLQELNLRLHTGTAVLKDAIAAYGQSLRKLKIRADVQAVHHRVMDPAVFGDWKLPLVRKIEIEVAPNSIIHIGDFCGPLMETFKFTVNNTRPGPEPILIPTGKPDRLAPVWRLPRLKTLQLQGAAARQFNYGSLDHCPNLEILRLTTSSYDYLSGPVATVQPVTHDNDCFQAPDCSNIGPSNQEVRWKSDWILSKLRNLELAGSPCAAFRLEWLKGCPALTCLKLISHNDLEPNVLLCRNDDSSTVSIASPTDDQLSTLQTRSRLGNSLTCVTLEGPWIISEDALLTLLTKYAPKVTELRVERIDKDPIPSSDTVTWHGSWLLRSFRKAMKIHQGAAQSAGGNGGRATMSPTRWGKLRYFACAYNLSWDDKEALGLNGISLFEVDHYKMTGKLIFKMGHQHYIRKKDMI
ncbi:hypothetical protein CPC16_006907 [Podila verticillata]|nr:hypothetical protein CPC16_006907 [Podila verticillata]